MKVIGFEAANINAKNSASAAAINTTLCDTLYTDAAKISNITKFNTRIGTTSISTNGSTWTLTPSASNTRMITRPTDAMNVERASPPRLRINSNPIQNGNSSTLPIANTITRSGVSERLCSAGDIATRQT